MIQPMGYDVISHTADLGFEARGRDLVSAFAQAGLALFEVMGQPDTGGELTECGVSSDGIDQGDLLVCMLSDLLALLELDGKYLEEVTDMVIVPPRHDEPGERLWRARLSGRCRRVNRDEERGLIEVKAITYHGLLVEEGPSMARVRVILDL